MAGVRVLDFDSPDERRTPEKTNAAVVHAEGATVARMVLEPGWSWASCIKPIAGTDSCQVRHLGLVQSGTMHVTHDDGTEVELRAGDTYVIKPGHDARVVGDEPFVAYEFESRAAEEWARG